MDTDQAETPLDFVCIGRRTSSKGGLVIGLKTITNGELGLTKLFAPKAAKRFVMGGIYQGASFTESTAMGLGAAKLVGQWGNSEHLMHWRAQDEAVDAQLKEKRMESDIKKRNEIDVAMLPLRKLYASYHRFGDAGAMEALEKAVARSLKRRPRAEEA